MSIQTIPAFLYMQRRVKWSTDYSSSSYEWKPDVWTFRASNDEDRIFVREITLTVDAPDDFDPVSGQVVVLNAEREKITAEFTAALKKNADKLQKLLALTNEVEA